MKFIQNLLLLLVFIKCSHQVEDPSFQRYCQRFNQGLIKHTIETDEKGDAIPNPHGDKCTVSMDFPARDEKEAEIYCRRWAIFVLVAWKVDGDRVSCTYENVYECEDNFDQIRGMCYKKQYELRTYSEAEEDCKKSHAGAEILKLHSKHQSELLEAVFGDTLTMYFIQPDKTLEQSSQFVGGEPEDPNSNATKNYVILYTYSIHYDVGPNTIIKLDANKKAFAMCMYQPRETILSFAVKAKNLGLLYHPTQLVGALAVWRTASHYTPSNLLNYPNSHEDICEASMKAILGTSDGTLLNLKPANTKRFSPEVKQSFNRAFGPFVYCQYTDSRKNLRRQIYFANKRVKGIACDKQSNILESDYSANWMRNLGPYGYSFSYYPEKNAKGLSFDAFPHALHSPMLCGLHYEKDVNREIRMCPEDWTPYQRSTGTVCHKYFALSTEFHRARAFCQRQGGDMSRWESYAEYQIVIRPKRLQIADWRAGPSDAWVKCFNDNGCNDVETTIKDRETKWPDLRSDKMFWLGSYEQSVICEKKAYQ
ncbi:unnamed protein product [Caenorhabditis angaria]|uniref:C-type lectin domain-containing protein n=1 Tax=Caenorhabditis angaria TaxID=860376 RepID=A0A9P1MVD9_9PELO|nr:unnamed protein product [Caenorhabditis angaria]